LATISPVGGSRPPSEVDGYATNNLSRGNSANDPFGAEQNSSPWYLKPWGLALWGLAVVLLITTIIYGLIILASNNGGTAPTPTGPSTTPSQTTTPSPSPTPSTTIPTTTAPSAETTEQPAPSSTAPPSTPGHSHHHHWNGTIPDLPGLPPIHIPGLN
jgi:cell division septation protein DedD